MYMPKYHDIALPLAWPDKTAYGDEKWMAFLKKIGIVKNLNFKVGHAAILLVERATGQVAYFDFGRYITPRGYGRARSKRFDPRLALGTRATFVGNTISNLTDILNELSSKEVATHGGGRLLFSLAKDISFEKAAAFAEALVDQGPILYGALAKNNNSCSRYVAQIMVAGMESNDSRIRKIYYPECLKASPTSNVVNASSEGHIYSFLDHQLESWTMSRAQSLRYQWGLITENLYSHKANALQSDTTLGSIHTPAKPSHLPHHAKWYGGIGEGIWLALMNSEESRNSIVCFDQDGEVIYEVDVYCEDTQLNLTQDYEFDMQFTAELFRIRQHGKVYHFNKYNASTHQTHHENVYEEEFIQQKKRTEK